MHISVVGLGKLGAPLAAVLADRGHYVVGVDSSPDAVNAINEGRAPVHEPGLDALVAAVRSRLTATSDGAAAAASVVSLGFSSRTQCPVFLSTTTVASEATSLTCSPSA